LPLLTVCLPYYGSTRTQKSIDSIFPFLSENLTLYILALQSDRPLLNLYALSPYVEIHYTSSPLLPSRARNILIRLVTSDYLTFLDSDDFVDPYTLILALSIIVDNPADLFLFPYQPFHFTDSFYFNSQGYIDKIMLARYYLDRPHGTSLIHHVWSKIFRRIFLLDNTIYFDEFLVVYEDLLFVSQAISCAQFIFLSMYQFYYYSSSSTGLSRFFYKYPLGFKRSLTEYRNILLATFDLDSNSLYYKALSYWFHKLHVLSRELGFLQQRYFLFRLVFDREMWKSSLYSTVGEISYLASSHNWFISLITLPLFSRIHSLTLHGDSEYVNKQ